MSKLSLFLTKKFYKYGECEILPGVKYSCYLNSMKKIYENWNKFNLSENDILVIFDNNKKDTLITILTALYYGHKICLIHNKLYLNNSLIKLKNIGEVEIISCGNICAIVHAKTSYNVEIIASTSGTTGFPNLVQHTGEGILKNLHLIEDYICLNEHESIYLQRNPIYLSVLVGEIFLGIDRGCRFVLPEDSINPKQMINDIEKYKVCFLTSVMSYFDMLLSVVRKYSFKLKTLRYLQFVGEGGRAGLIEDLQKLLPNTELIVCYGLTEAGTRVSYLSNKEMNMEKYAAGKCLKGIQVRIVDNEGNVLNPYEKGTIEISSPSNMIGYVGDNLCGNWLRTSDLGWIDRKGHLYVQGRIDNIAIINGIKVPLTLIEQHILSSGMVTGAIAYMKKNNMNNLTQIDVVVSTLDYDNTFPDKMMNWCRRNMDKHMWPHRIFVVEKFIFEKNGKINKSATLELALQKERI